jgi:hypothetical protein
LSEIAESSAHHKPQTKVSVVAMEKPWGTLYKLKAYITESRDQFLFVTEMTVRAKAALREMNIRFARVPYSESEAVAQYSSAAIGVVAQTQQPCA